MNVIELTRIVSIGSFSQFFKTDGKGKMKSTGIVRNIDELGRIVIPKEIRKKLGINNNDPVEIYVEGERVLLAKYHPACHFCAGTDGIMDFKGKVVCRACLEELSSISDNED